MDLKISEIKKSFGRGDSRTEVLKGVSFEIKKATYVFCSDRQVQENQRC